MIQKARTLLRLGLLPACLLLAGSLHAQGCYTWTTVGRYIVTCDGFLAPAPNASLVPARVLGVTTADENGTFKGSATVSLGGTIVTQTVTGTEKLNRDCTGTISYSQTLGGQPCPPLDLTFVVSEQGNKINGLATDAGTVMSCVLTRIPAVSATLQQGSPVKQLASKVPPKAGPSK